MGILTLDILMGCGSSIDKDIRIKELEISLADARKLIKDNGLAVTGDEDIVVKAYKPNVATTSNTKQVAMSIPAGRTFSASDSHGGEAVEATKLGLVMIEFQNEFTSEGGKLHDGVKPVMEETGMMQKANDAAAAVRAAGGKVLHCPISFAADMSDNPNKNLGILKGCADGGLFVEGTWNSEICSEIMQAEGDLKVTGKKGLDAFPGTDLEELLVANGLTTVALCGFLSNCCVESTMRTACEKGFNVVTLKDCSATTSSEGHKVATEGTWGMFSTPMTKDEFVAALR